MLLRIIRHTLRFFANHCIFPKIRVWLFQLSGIRIGKDTFINMGANFIDNYHGDKITIGDRVAIAPNVFFIADSDPNNSILSQKRGLIKRGSILVGDDAWIGANVTILPDVNIGKLAIVGAGSVVTKDVEDYSVVVGNPAKKIGDTRDEKYG